MALTTRQGSHGLCKHCLVMSSKSLLLQVLDCVMWDKPWQGQTSLKKKVTEVTEEKGDRSRKMGCFDFLPKAQQF